MAGSALLSRRLRAEQARISSRDIRLFFCKKIQPHFELFGRFYMLSIAGSTFQASTFA
jgi:hypothetical protein